VLVLVRVLVIVLGVVVTFADQDYEHRPAVSGTEHEHED